MNRRILSLASIVVFFAGTAFAQEVPDLTRWRARAAIVSDRFPQNGVVELPVGRDVFDAALPGLADVRIIDEVGAPVGWLLRDERPEVREDAVRARILNRVQRGRDTQFVMDFGKKIEKNVLRLATSGRDFRRRVLIEGCDDGRSWATVRDGALLFRVNHPEKAWEKLYNKDTVEFAVNDMRYLRVTVSAGDGDAGVPAVSDAVAVLRVRPALALRQENAAPKSVETKDGVTTVEFDLGYCHLPIERLVIDVGDAFFHRSVRVEGRNAPEREIDVVMEDGSKTKRVEPESWTPVTSGTLWRFGAESGAEANLTLAWNGSGFRFVRILVENLDDAPLTIRSLTAEVREVRVVFAPRSSGPFFLYVGNPDAPAPHYDLAHYVSALPEKVDGRVDPLAPNPDFGKTTTESPLAAIAMWAALLVAGAVIGALVWRQYRRIAANEGS
ncbi:MAG: DUF3999 family protein [Deltaproteobacteria bacterium]|nr:DUF3999 family protein [Deltaproteobacteria bacterium]